MSNTFTITLQDLKTTTRVGKIISQAILDRDLRHIFMTGALGSGKTTLTGTIVEHLPNAANCEVASPSFSLINYYPTRPKIQHADLYRCQDNIPDELLDNLENPNIVTLLEWSQFLPQAFWPAEVLHLTFDFGDVAINSRRLTWQALGAVTRDTLAFIQTKLM